MSIYDQVIAEMGQTKAHPRHNEFTSYFGYAGGKVIDSFPDKKAAETAGAITTEKVFDKDAYKQASAQVIAYNTVIMTEYDRRLRAEHNSVNDAVFNLAYGMAYERGHSCGYSEVESYLYDYIDFAEKVIAASKAA